MEYTASSSTEVLPDLCRAITDLGSEHESRGGTVRELLNVGITLTDPVARYMVAVARNASLPALIVETAWVLSGCNSISTLQNYLPRAASYSDDGETWRAGYGPRLRRFGTNQVDQLRKVVQRLALDPNTRQAVATIWDADEDNVESKDIPCNNWLHFMPHAGRLDLHVATRSNDLIWGWSGINAFQWSVLLEVVAKFAGLAVGSIHFHISTLHVYKPYWAKAERIAKASEVVANNSGYGRPFWASSIAHLDEQLDEFWRMENRIRYGLDSAQERLAQINDMETRLGNPMFREWLLVLEKYWNGGLVGELWELSPVVQRALDETPKRGDDSNTKAFVKHVSRLHAEKHAAYGDSWKRRGELVGILANIARKVDRLANDKATPDESKLDTAVDLWVYLLKYGQWLGEQLENGGDSDDPDLISDEVQRSARQRGINTPDEYATVAGLAKMFDQLQEMVTEQVDRSEVLEHVGSMASMAGGLAEYRWNQQEAWKQSNSTRVWNGYDWDDA